MITYQPRPKGVNAKQRGNTAQIRSRKPRRLLKDAEITTSYAKWPLPGDEEMI